MRRTWRRLVRAVLVTAVVVPALSVGVVVLYGSVAPPLTPLMLIRAVADGAAIDKDWVGLDAVSPDLIRAVIASEDSGFCRHGGFDWTAIRDAFATNEAGRSLRGGSTISNQTAKNAFLWPDRTWLRKGVEAWFTLLIETLWTKRRIAEVYLNIIEWGDGVYGAEAAARAHFGKPAAALSSREAALLAVVLPNPRERDPAKPGRTTARRATVVQQRMAVVERDGLAACVLDQGRG